jgi:hypothetical protein
MALATLSIDIEARLARLEAELAKAGRLAEKQASLIEDRFNKLDGVARKVGTALAKAFAGVSVVAFIKSTVNALDALNDVADATGATVENLSALEDVARRNGGTLDSVAGILVKFNGALKEADGKNGVSQALKAIGLNAEELRKLDPAEALRRTAVALAGYADDGNKARLVQELFGKNIREAAPFLKDLAEQGQLNATVTAQQARESEIFNKQLYAFQTNASNAGRAIVSDLIPAMNLFFDRLKGLKEAGGFGAFFASIGAEFRANDVSADLNRIVGRIESLQTAIDSGNSTPRMVKRLATLRAEAAELSREAAKAADQLKGFGAVALPKDTASGRPANEGGGGLRSRSIGDIFGGEKAPKPTGKAPKPEFVGPLIDEARLDAIKRLESTDTAKIAALNAQLTELLNLQRSGTKGDFVGAIENVRKELEALNPEAKAAAENAARFAALIGATPTVQLEKAREDVIFLRQEFDRTGKSLELFVEAANVRLAQVADNVKPAFDKITEFTKQFERNVQDAMGETIKATLRGDFDDIGRLWGNLLLDMAAQALAADIGNKLFGNVEGGKNIFSSILGFLGFAKGGVFSGGAQVKAFAAGGVVGSPTYFGMAGGMGLMGEAGPEAVMPLKRGRDGKLGVAAQGGGVTIINNVAAGVQRSELLAALQLSGQATEARLVGMLRTRGVI